MLLEHERRLSQDDIRSLIEASGSSGRLLRPTQSGAGSFDGPVESGESVAVEAFPLEWRPLSPDDLKQWGHSGIAHVLPELDVSDGDIVEFNDHRYRVTDVRPIDLFGTPVYQVVQLEREYRG